MRPKFDKKKYEEEIGKLTITQARKALVREAELRFNAQRELFTVSSQLIELTEKLHERIARHLRKMGIAVRSPLREKKASS
jgi:pyruvate formate-lyase activating enzyme-like uncharacterized protein